MKKKQLIKETLVVPQGMVALANGEAAQDGTAVLARNVRERERSLQVTGVPATVGQIEADARLLVIHDDHNVTCSGHVVKIDGVEIARVGHDIVGAHVVGDAIVIVTTGGLVHVGQQEGTWVVLDPHEAVPTLTFGASLGSKAADISAYSFVTPYSQWRAPLSSEDATTLEGMLRTAWSAMNSDCRAEGRHTAPMLVRWAVRLKDGNYLWMSEPVRVGDETLANVERISARVTTSSNAFTGIEATVMNLLHYKLEIGVEWDVAPEWMSLVAGIDVFATSEAQLLTDSRSLDYRCLTRTTGSREYVLEMGLSRRSADAISVQLSSSPWHLIATAPIASHVSGGDFVAPLQSVTLTNGACASIGQMMTLDDVVCSTTAAGRLYCCTRGGELVVSAPGNAFVEVSRRSVLGTRPLALAVMTRPLYSSGFGRYPVYVFTRDGIYAVPQTPQGVLGEARLVDRTVAHAGVTPVEAGRDVWFMSRHGHLCRLAGSMVTVVQRDVDCVSMSWCNAHGELWLLSASGYPTVVMDSGRTSERTLNVAQLYNDALHSVAITATGEMLDLEQETPAMMPVTWHSHPLPLDPLMACAVHRVVWHLVSTGARLTLEVDGHRGMMAQVRVISRMTVDGAIDQPLAAPTMAVQGRTMRLLLDGEAMTGTLMLPSILYWSKTVKRHPQIP